jgi:CYTH domain-containing protein
MSIPKYSKLEIERRWLVPAEFGQTFKLEEAHTLIEDIYLECGRLRLRSMINSVKGEKEFKLCKKYGQTSEFSEPITNIYLSEEEFRALQVLKGNPITKKRYKKEFNGEQFSFDVFHGKLEGLVLCEIEGADIHTIQEIKPPAFVIKEVTGDLNFSGGELSKRIKN